jgi:ABC-2 type transport system ATP-binding protein
MHKTVLISSHILTELGEICDSVAIIEAGHILASGSIADIRKLQRQKRGQHAAATLSARLIRRADEAERWLLEQPFVSHVTVSGNQVAFEFDGDEAAQHELLKRMLESA